MVQKKDIIDAILMASGFSKRFGKENKLLVNFNGKPLARHTLELVCNLSCHFNKIFLVANENKVCDLAYDLPVTIIRNENPERGQRESIRLGVKESNANYYMFFPCDQPLLNSETVESILEKRKEGFIVQPSFNGKVGNPALFSNYFRDSLINLAEGECGRDIKKKYPNRIITIEVKREEVLLDIDKPEILHKILNI